MQHDSYTDSIIDNITNKQKAEGDTKWFRVA